jgi:anion-transporting  ArsA/GET3 family ATPase
VSAASVSEGDLSASGLHLLDRELIFVTGKGGVGKTTIAAALARVAARSGRRTLICEMDAKGDLGPAIIDPAEENPERVSLDFTPRLVAPNLWAMAMNTEDSLREYLRLFLRIPMVGRIGALASTFDFVASAAPGVKEILAVGKLCHEVRQRSYDLVIVDAEASGHIVAQIGAPIVIRELVALGPIRDQTAWMSEILTDPARTSVVAVTTPEEMAVNETVELAERLRAHAGVELSMVVANRVLPALFDRRRLELLERIQPMIPAESRWGHIVQSAAAADRRRRVGAGHLDDLRTRLLDPYSGTLETINVPEIRRGRSDVTLVADVATALAGELDVEPHV